MANAIVVMTAMPPTRGHAYLIKFASEYLDAIDGGKVHVIVCSRPMEPIAGSERAQAIADHFRHDNRIWVHHRESIDPQYPSDHPDFWRMWRDVVLSKVNSIGSDDILFASDSYGIEFAQRLGCRFLPCDPAREIVDVAATKVRLDPIKHFDDILPEFSRRLTKTVTFFGAESTGKTTMSRFMAEHFSSHWCHEWARPYLEMCGPEVTDERMANIVAGQVAAQKAVAALPPKPFIFQDTDLMSTLGYYQIYGGAIPEHLHSAVKDTPSDLYVVMNSRIPFEHDRLRYGGDRRESTDEFWTDLLSQHNRPFYVVKSVEHFAQVAEIRAELLKLYHGHTDWSWFSREAA